jgi:hypothetical protein
MNEVVWLYRFDEEEPWEVRYERPSHYGGEWKRAVLIEVKDHEANA